MNKKHIFIIGITIIALLVSVLTLFKGNRSSLLTLDNRLVSPDILYLTFPVTSFSGKVEKIEGNTITVSQQMMLQQTILPVTQTTPGQPPAIPTPVSKTLTYKVTVGKNTQIARQPIFVNYLFRKTVPPIATKLNLDDIKVGQTVTVSSTTDLRTLSAPQFEAVDIQLSSIINTLNGKIVDIKGNSLTLKAVPPLPPSATVNAPAAAVKEQEYIVSITDETEISRINFPSDPSKQSTPEKLSISDLKKDMRVTVYTNDDVTNAQTVNALRIEPMIIAPPPETVATPPNLTPTVNLSPTVSITIPATPSAVPTNE